jgi:hypothetical protein
MPDAWYTKPEWWAIVFSTVMSFAALTQSSWGPALKARFRPRHLDIELSGRPPDVNFGGNSGSTFGVSGSITSRNSDSTVRTFRATVRRISDDAEFTLDAVAVRNRLTSVTAETVTGSYWNPYQVTADIANAFDFGFSDMADMLNVYAFQNDVRAQWPSRFGQAAATPPNTVDVANAALASSETFNDPKYAAFITEIETGYLKFFYWNASEYHITLFVHVDGDKTTYRHQFAITITPEMERMLRGNARRAIANSGYQYRTIPRFRPSKSLRFASVRRRRHEDQAGCQRAKSAPAAQARPSEPHCGRCGTGRHRLL